MFILSCVFIYIVTVITAKMKKRKFDSRYFSFVLNFSNAVGFFAPDPVSGSENVKQ